VRVVENIAKDMKAVLPSEVRRAQDWVGAPTRLEGQKLHEQENLSIAAGVNLPDPPSTSMALLSRTVASGNLIPTLLNITPTLALHQIGK